MNSIRDVVNEVRWAWQRVFRGWDDRVTWDICGYLSDKMPQWIRKMRDESMGYPAGDEFESLSEADAVAKWNGILDGIAEGFEAHNAEDDVTFESSKTLEQYEAETAVIRAKRDAGLELFKQYYGSLWW